MRSALMVVALSLLPLPAGAASEHIAGALETELQPPAITTYQITQYLARRTPTLPAPSTGADWTAEARRLRRKLLEEVVLRGWPREWVSAPPRIEDLGAVASTRAYRIRKLRYEVVPGYRAPAILCEPAQATKPVPGVLNLVGHEADGKAVAQPVSPGADLGVDATARPQRTGANYQMLVNTLGARTLGIQASHLLGVARWATGVAGPRRLRVETSGVRTQMVALAAAALEPRTLATVVSREALPSLRALLDERVQFRVAPEVFCLDLYKEFDVDRLTALAEPTAVHHEGGRQ